MKKQKKTGRVSIYICYSEGYFGKLRPAHDTIPDVVGELTEDESRRLLDTIDRFIERCHKRHGKFLLDAALARGDCTRS